ncbi:MAG: hypothetical protein WAM30_03900 [Candidatus Dormiibacterota bacterium]
MESHPRTPPGAHRLRLLNVPAPVELRLERNLPASVRLRGRWRPVDRVEEVWRVQDGWWREQEIARTYLRLLLDDGHVVTIYRDDTEQSWWAQRY